MVHISVLVLTILLFLMVFLVVARAVVRKQQIIGKPPIPVFFFLLGKALVVVNLAFLLTKGLNIYVKGLYWLPQDLEWIPLVLMVGGILILYRSVISLGKALIFGLPDPESHTLQTRGIYALSRHPFYLGFLMVLLSSCIFVPNYFNIAAFLGAWLIHHFIMIREEQFLEEQYGEEYRLYKKQVGRYVNLHFK